jgi:hypothetical protein
MNRELRPQRIPAEKTALEARLMEAQLLLAESQMQRSRSRTQVDSKPEKERKVKLEKSRTERPDAKPETTQGESERRL